MLQMRKPRLRRSSSLKLPSHEVTEQGFAAGLSGLTPRLHSLRLENPSSQPRPFGQRWERWAQGHSQNRFSELGVPGPLAGVIPRIQSFLHPCILANQRVSLLCFSSAHHSSPPGLSSPLGGSSTIPPAQAPEMPQPRPFRLESLDIPFTKAKRKKSKSSFGSEPL